MSNEINAPKESFLVDYFNSIKSKSSATAPSRPFSEVLDAAQLKTEKADLSELLNKPQPKAEEAIDGMNNSAAVFAVRQTIDILRVENT